MTDSQLRQTINQFSHAASGTQFQAYATPTPQRTAGKVLPPSSSPISSYCSSRRCKYLTRKISPIGLHLRLFHPARPRGAAALREAAISRLRLRPLRHPHLLIPRIQPPAYQLQPTIPLTPVIPSLPTDSRNTRPRAPLLTTPQAIQSTYSSRLQTGATFLGQPIFSSPSAAAAATVASASTRPRRGGIVSYCRPWIG